MERLPQDLVVQHFFGSSYGLADVQLLWLVGAIAVATTPRDRRPLRQLAAPLQVHLGGGRGRAPAAHVRARHGDQRAAPDPGVRTDQRPAVRAAQGDPRRLPGRLPVGEPRAPRGAGHAARARCRLPPLPYLAPMVAMWAIALGIVVVQRDLGAALAVLRRLPGAALRRDRPDQPGAHRAGPVPARQRGDGQPVRARPDADRRLAGPVRRPARVGLPGDPGAPCLRPRRAARASVSAAGLPEVGGRPPIPEIHTDFPFAALGEELGVVGLLAILGIYLVIVQRGLRIGVAAADDFRSLLAIGLALVIGIQAFIIAAGQPQGAAADRGHTAVHQLWRLVAAGQRAGRSGCSSRCRTRASSPRRHRGRSRAGAGSAGAVPPDARVGPVAPADRGADRPRRGGPVGRRSRCSPARPATGG